MHLVCSPRAAVAVVVAAVAVLVAAAPPVSTVVTMLPISSWPS